MGNLTNEIVLVKYVGVPAIRRIFTCTFNLNVTTMDKLVTDTQTVYYNTACRICLKAYKDIQRCKLCKTVAYCSKEHQERDWPVHKKICKVITRTHQRLQFNKKGDKFWNEFRLSLRLVWEHELRRRLCDYELQMMFFPRVCAICYKNEDLFDCEKCLCVAYCSERHVLAHKQAHGIYCNKLRFSLVFSQFRHVNVITGVEIEFDSNSPKNCSNTLQEVLSCFKYKGWERHVKSGTSDEDHTEILDTIKTNYVGTGLTILYAVRKTTITGKTLVIHLVGASQLEATTKWDVVTDMFVHCLEVDHVSYWMIGPECDCGNDDDFEDEHFGIYYRKNRYDEIENKIEKPDLIVTFNAGFHEHENDPEDPWKSSISTLLRTPRVPLVVTSYTETELKRDAQIIRNTGLKLNVIRDIERNPFAHKMPLRNWTSQDCPVFYINNYIYVVESVSD